MADNNAFIELHYYSGGLKSQFTGANTRPEWIPDKDLVGLHNDVFPAQGEYVVELSRHSRADKLITWIGVYSYGKDDQYGDRANYNGVGAWLVDAIPIHTSSIVSALREVCDLLVRQGPTESVKKECINVHEFLPNWILSIDQLPVVSNGVVFDATSHPETLYIRADNRDIDRTLQNISSSIERNCIVAENDFAKFSRILYLLLRQSVEIKNIKHLINLPESYSPTEDLITYFGKSNLTLKKDAEDFKLINSYLENEVSTKTTEIDALSKQVLQLQQYSVQLVDKNNELSLILKRKNTGQLLEELRENVNNLSAEDASKNNLLMIIDSLDKSRPLQLECTKISQDLTPQLNQIIRSIEALKVNGYRNGYEPTLIPQISGRLEEEDSWGIFKRIIMFVILGGAIAFVVYQAFKII